MQQDIPKQFINVYEKPVIIHTLEVFEKHPNIDSIVVVCIDGWHSILSAYCIQYNITKLAAIVSGGSCGQASIKNGLMEIKSKFELEDIVLIHDAIRPMVSEEILSSSIRVATEYGNAITVIPCAEAMLKTSDDISSTEQVSRDSLKRTQTPQTFVLSDILQVHEEAESKGIVNSVASCTLYIELGRKLFFSYGSEKNIKLTTPDDIDIFKSLLNTKRR